MDTSLLGFDSLDTFSSHYTSNGFRGAASEAPQTCSKKYSEEWFSLFEQGDIARRLKEKALRLELADCRFRSICWKIFLECLPDSRNDWIIATRAMRHKYESLLAKTCHNPRMELEDLDLAYNNPLSQDEKSPWNQYFEDSELRIMIKQDVIRTFPEIEFFQTSDVQAMMVNVLFHYARQHPQISYRQGMHELLAPIIFVLHNDQQAFLHALELDYIREFQDALRDDIRELLNPDYTEHDAFFLFNQVMDAVESWYSWNENYVKIDQFSFMPFAKTSTLGLHNGLGVKLCRINQSMLKAHDFAIYTHLENMEIPLHVFGIRWLRLLFGREFILPELLILWDAIFADSLAFNLVDYIFVAMLICIRKPLLNSDYAKCLSFLMKYPAGRNVTYILQLALHLKDAKKYFKPGEQEFEVYSPSLVTKISGKSLLAVDAPRSIGRPVGRPNTLGIQASSSRASSEPTTLESGSEVSDEESAASRGKGRAAPLRSQPKHNQVWSFRGIKKNPITQSLSLLASSGSEGDQHEKEMVQLNSTVAMRHGSIEGSEVPPWQRHNSVADTQVLFEALLIPWPGDGFFDVAGNLPPPSVSTWQTDACFARQSSPFSDINEQPPTLGTFIHLAWQPSMSTDTRGVEALLELCFDGLLLGHDIAVDMSLPRLFAQALFGALLIPGPSGGFFDVAGNLPPPSVSTWQTDACFAAQSSHFPDINEQPPTLDTFIHLAWQPPMSTDTRGAEALLKLCFDGLLPGATTLST
nr:TBC1 domain family member 5-like isoform X1 [Dermacentor andersoni]